MPIREKKPALTDAAIKNAKPGEKPYKKYDKHGLYLLINPKGLKNPKGSKLWRYGYKFGGKQKSMALGDYSVVTLAEARDLHHAARKLRATGIDPMEARKQKVMVVKKEAETLQHSAENTFEKVARRWWAMWSGTVSSEHAKAVMQRLETDVFPAYGHKPIDTVMAADIREIMVAIQGRGTGVVARLAKQHTGQIFRYAFAFGLVTRNPAAEFESGDILGKYKGKNFPRIGAKDLPELLVDIWDYPGDILTRLAMRLMLYCFVRTRELTKTPWTEIDFAATRWEIPKERMKKDTPHIVPLSRQAMEVLHELQRLTGDGEMVFPGQRNNRHMGSTTILHALYGLGWKGEMTGHGFRGLATTILLEVGNFNKQHCDVQLAHLKRNKTDGAYDYAQYLPQRALMLQWWGDYIDAALEEGRRRKLAKAN